MGYKDYTGKALLIKQLSQDLNREVNEEELNDTLISLYEKAKQEEDEVQKINKVRTLRIFNYMYGIEDGGRIKTNYEVSAAFSTTSEMINGIRINMIKTLNNLLEMPNNIRVKNGR